MILLPFFSSFFAPFLGGYAVFALELVPRAPRNTGGERVLRFFPPCKRGGQRARCDIFAPNTGGRRFFCPFFGNVFGSSVPFLFFFEGWASEKEAAEATRAEELGGEEVGKEVEAEEQGGEEEERRRRNRNRRR